MRRAACSTVLLVAVLASGATRAALPAGDAERGRQVFQPCRTCHYPETGLRQLQRTEPQWHLRSQGRYTRGLHRLFEDTARRPAFVWTPELLDAWLASPGEFLADSTMIFVGIPDPQARADLIAYLQSFSKDSAQVFWPARKSHVSTTVSGFRDMLSIPCSTSQRASSG